MADVVSLLVEIALSAFVLGGWLLYFRERSRSRDYVTDLSQLIHDYDLSRGDLRRSLGHQEVEQRLERQENGD